MLPTRLAAGASLAGALMLAATSPAPAAGQGTPATTPAPATASPTPAAAATLPVRTGVRAFSLDRSHSQINFEAEARLISAEGWFDKWEADVQLDPEQLERGSVRFTIDAASINTRVERRDNHLRSAEFFDVAKYPTITFASKAIRRTGDKTGVITGDLTMHGVTKTIDVPVSMVFYENGRGRFKGSFTLNRQDYGVSGQSRMNKIEDEVEVKFQMAIVDRAPAA